ncbi:MAG: hypothetical protein ONB37_13525 [candidate division KSB1 bacterium]|nr:hypothetical protein [candidate division KSB1 bacterium]
MHSIKNFKLIMFITAAVACLLVMQCYTTFRHPPVVSQSDSTDVAIAKQIDFLDDCSSCHEQHNPIDNSHWQLYDSPRLQESYNWQYFYAIPWWVDAYYYEDGKTQQNSPLPATQRRDFDRRDPAGTSAIPAGGAPGTSLARPATGSGSNETSQPEPPPAKRNERREIRSGDTSGSQPPVTPAPERKKRQDQQSGSKKEKE